MNSADTRHYLHPMHLVRLANALGRRFLNNGAALISLAEMHLLNRACQQTGLDDLGDESFRQPLSKLLESLEKDAELHIVGRLCVRYDVLRLLGNRLRLVRDRKHFPEIAGESVQRPLFITGLPRTGSTFLHGLLAQDPANRVPQVWEVMYPSPPPERVSYHTDPRLALTDRKLKLIDILMPDLSRVHLINARLPQECIAITSHAFRSHYFETMYNVHSYRAWHDRQDKRPAYEWHRQFLQHLQWRCPGRRWVLKAPAHLLNLEALFAIYPDAGVIMTHRDPLKVLPSCASFLEILRSAFTDRLDKVALGHEMSRRWQEGAWLAIDFRSRPENPESSFFDVRYADLVRDPMAMVRAIYGHFQLELSDAASAAMHYFIAEHPKDKKGVHHYSLREFGLNPEEERAQFQFYLDFFGVEPEVRSKD